MAGPTIAELQVRLNVRGLHYVTSLEQALKRVGGRAIRSQLDAQARAILGLEKANARAAKAAERAAVAQTKAAQRAAAMQARIGAQQARESERNSAREAKARERAAAASHRVAVKQYQSEMRLRQQAARAAEREAARAARAAARGPRSFRLGGGASFGGIMGGLADFSLVAMGVVRGFRMIGGAIESALDPLVEFQKNVTQVRVKGGFSAKETAGLSENFKQLSRNTIYSPQQVSSAAIDIAASGLSGKEITTALPTILRFAQAGDLPTNEASDILVNTMRQLGTKPESMEHIGDLMVKTANMSTINVSELAATMKYAAVPAKQLGVPMEQMFAMMGVLGNFGIKGSKAGTGMRNLISSLARPPRRGKTAAKILGKIGMTQEDLKNGSSDIPALLANMQGKMDKAKFTNADKVEMAAVLFGQYGMTSAGALGDASVDNGPNSLKEFTQALIESRGELQKSADIMGGTYAAKMQRLQGQWDLLKITVGEKFGPALGRMLDNTTKMVQQWEQWADKNPAILADLGRMAEAFATGLPKAIQATISALQLMQPILTPIVSGLSSVAQAWADTVTNQDGQRAVSAEDEAAANAMMADKAGLAAGPKGSKEYEEARRGFLAGADKKAQEDKAAAAAKALEDSQSRIRLAQAAKESGDPTVAGDLLSGAGPLERSPAGNFVDINIRVDEEGTLKAFVKKLKAGDATGLRVASTNQL